ncbi:peptidyl-prolyl cis-trans isomerase, partial [Candidatus Bipolaricaulota bacterium]|nr:peptidyl-prolyl cis-trans isomerase [Candidatus Bipolaricaulota bacterium]
KKSEEGSTPAAYVNGEPVEATVSELQQSAQEKLSRGIRSLMRSTPDLASFLYKSKSLRKTITERYTEHLLDQEILKEIQRQNAKSMGITVSKDRVEKELKKRVDQQIQRIISQNKQLNSIEDVKKILQERGRTLEGFKQRLRDRMGGASEVRFSLLQSKLKDKVLGPAQEPTDKEIKSYYEENKNSYKDEEGNLKPLKQVKEQIKGKLKQQATQKRNKNWQEWLQKAKEKATIERKL